MDKRNYRRFTAEEKRTILEETQQPGVTMSEVCRKHSVSPGLVYRWRAVAQQATTQALQKVDSRGKSQPDAQTARLEAELERMRRVVAEITAENLELKKKTLGLQGRVRLSAQQKQEVLALVELTQRRSEWPLEAILCCLGVPRSVYLAWRARAHSGQLADTPRGPASYERLLPDEVQAIKAFALRHPKTGYRKLTYMMLDQDIVCASESAVYRVLREADLLSRWKRSRRSSGVYNFRPTAPNQHGTPT